MNVFEKYIDLTNKTDELGKVIGKLCCAYLMGYNDIRERVNSHRAIKFLSWQFVDSLMNKIRINYKAQKFETNEVFETYIDVNWSELVFNVNDYE